MGSLKSYVSSHLFYSGQNGFQGPLQDLKADILQPAANARDQTVIIQTGGGTTLLTFLVFSISVFLFVCLFKIWPGFPVTADGGR